MPGHEDKTDEIDALFSRPFLGACGIIIALCGMVVGLWSSSIERDINGIRLTLNERASLIPRTTELEKRTDDQEGRLREIERSLYRNGH